MLFGIIAGAVVLIGGGVTAVILLTAAQKADTPAGSAGQGTGAPERSENRPRPGCATACPGSRWPLRNRCSDIVFVG